MRSAYHQALKALEDRKCKACGGIGEQDDFYPGDIYYNSWTCKNCGGSGFADALPPEPYIIESQQTVDGFLSRWLLEDGQKGEWCKTPHDAAQAARAHRDELVKTVFDNLASGQPDPTKPHGRLA